MVTTIPETTCPGCGLQMPQNSSAHYDGYYNTTPECWIVYTDVLGSEYSNAMLFGQVHQLTVDSYAVQHAGLRMVLEQGMRPPDVPRVLQRLASVVKQWPHFAPPADTGPLTVCDVALADSPADHMEIVRAWARQMWHAWSNHHAAVEQLLRSAS